jgi:hypothetical protein
MFSRGCPRPPHSTFQSITQERVAWLISYFCGIAGWVGGGALSILNAIRYSVGPPGGYLWFHIPDCNSRTDHPMDFIFLWHSRVGWGRCPIDFGCDLIFNMAARRTSWILYSADCNCRTGCPIDFIFLWHSRVSWGRCPIDFRRDPIFNMATRQTSWILYSGL